MKKLITITLGMLGMLKAPQTETCAFKRDNFELIKSTIYSYQIKTDGAPLHPITKGSGVSIPTDDRPFFSIGTASGRGRTSSTIIPISALDKFPRTESWKFIGMIKYLCVFATYCQLTGKVEPTTKESDDKSILAVSYKAQLERFASQSTEVIERATEELHSLNIELFMRANGFELPESAPDFPDKPKPDSLIMQLYLNDLRKEDSSSEREAEQQKFFHHLFDMACALHAKQKEQKRQEMLSQEEEYHYTKPAYAYR